MNSINFVAMLAGRWMWPRTLWLARKNWRDRSLLSKPRILLIVISHRILHGRLMFPFHYRQRHRLLLSIRRPSSSLPSNPHTTCHIPHSIPLTNIPYILPSNHSRRSRSSMTRSSSIPKWRTTPCQATNITIMRMQGTSSHKWTTNPDMMFLAMSICHCWRRTGRVGCLKSLVVDSKVSDSIFRFLLRSCFLALGRWSYVVAYILCTFLLSRANWSDSWFLQWAPSFS